LTNNSSLLNASSDDLAMMHFFLMWLVKQFKYSLGRVSANYKQLCWGKRLLLTVLPSAACLALLPKVITCLGLLAEQLVQTLLYSSKNKRASKDLQFKPSRLIVAKTDSGNLSPWISCRSNLTGV